MPLISLSAFNCYYEYEDHQKHKTLILSNSLGADLNMWNLNIPFLSSYFNIVRYDMRGHGKSSNAFNKNNLISIEDLGNDVLELISYLNKNNLVTTKLVKANTLFCGLSIGGQIGQWLGINHSSLFNKIIICATAAKIGTNESWNERISKVNNEGIKSVSQGTIERWLTTNFRENNKDQTKQIKNTIETTKLQGYIGCCFAVRDADFRKNLQEITVQTLIISATQDLVTTVNDGDFLEKAINNAIHKKLNALHLCNLEDPKLFAQYIIDFSFQ